MPIKKGRGSNSRKGIAFQHLILFFNEDFKYDARSSNFLQSLLLDSPLEEIQFYVQVLQCTASQSPVQKSFEHYRGSHRIVLKFLY